MNKKLVLQAFVTIIYQLVFFLNQKQLDGRNTMDPDRSELEIGEKIQSFSNLSDL